MGEVFRARDTRLGREVAIKVLPKGMATDAAAAARFDQEARAVAALSHPHILAIHDFGQHEGVSYAVAELLEGETLRDRVNTGRMPLRKAVDVALQIAQGLAAAHAKSIIHRDLKPENIFLTSDGHAKILDFGLAKVQAVAESDQTRTAAPTDPGTVLGTTGYLSPEQAQAKPVDTRSDIFSFGAVLYEMLTAKRAFKGDSTIDTLHSIVHDAPPAIDAVSPDVPRELRWVLDKCLAKDPEDRYQSTRDLVVDLKNIARSLDSSPKLPVTPSAPTANRGRSLWPVSIAAIAIAAAAVFVMVRERAPSVAAPRSDVSSLSIERITTLGTVIDAAVSPDGKYVAYVTSENTRQGLWLRQLATASTIPLVPPEAGQGFWGATFAPDGSAVYFTLFTPDEPARAIYRIPILGGTPRKLAVGADTFPTFSPDGSRMAWFRSDYPEQGSSVLMVADADGQNARVLATRKPPEFFAPVFFTAPAWSPDGSFIVCPVERREPTVVGTMLAINANDGSVMPFPRYEWPGVGQPAWLPDGSGLIAVATHPTNRRTQLWRIDARTADRQLLTNDQSDYRKVSITADAQSVVAVAAEAAASIWAAPVEGTTEPRRVTTGRYDGISGVAAVRGGRVLFRTVDNGSNIWIANEDGSGRTQLTTEGFVSWPVATADGRSLIYVREGSGLWQIGLDGQGARSIPGTAGGLYPETTPDGQSIIFASQQAGFEQLSRIPIGGGAAVAMLDFFSTRPSVSPDGKQVAFYFRKDIKSSVWLGMMPIDGTAPTREFEVAPSGAYLTVRWTADGKGLLHNSAVGDRANIWLQPIDGSAPRKVTRFPDQQIMAFDRSADGKHVLVARGTITRDAFLLKGF